MVTYLKRGKDADVRAEDNRQVREIVEATLDDIAKRGDESVRELSIKFDNCFRFYAPDDGFFGHQVIIGNGSSIWLDAKSSADKTVAQNNFLAVEAFFDCYRFFDLSNEPVFTDWITRYCTCNK